MSAGVLRDRLQKEMNHLAGTYRGPKFEPHVTLLPAFDAADDEAAKRAAQKVATSLKARLQLNWKSAAAFGLFRKAV